MTVLAGVRRGELVGRLFNRAPISEGNEIADDHYYAKSRFMQEEASPSFVGAVFSPFHNHSKTTIAVDYQPRHSQKLRERRESDGKINKKKSFLDDHRERVESEAEDETSNEDWGWGLEEEDGFADDEKSPLHHPVIQDTPSPAPPKQKSNTQPTTTFAKTKPSISTAGKKRRKSSHKSVSFAGSLMLMEKSNQTDFVLQSDFVDIVDIVDIPHFSQYRQEIYEALWYSRDEIEQMKRDYFYWKRISRSGGKNPYAKASPAPMSRRLSHEGKSHNLRFLRHQRTLATVFREQERQRHMCHQIYGRIVDSFGDHHIGCVLDPERLKEVYRKAGKTLRRQNQAIERAKHSQIFYDEETMRTTFSSIGTAAATTITTNPTTNLPCYNHHHHHQLHQQQEQEESHLVVEQDIPEWSSTEASCSRSCLNVSTPTSQVIHCIFFALISPFLEQRGQPLFLDIGEEMIVTG